MVISWRGSVQPASARCPSPEGHESNCSNDTKWHEAKCKDCRLGLWGLKGVAVCLTFQHKSCRQEQCADTGHLAFTSSIIHHFKNEFCRFPSKPRFSYSTPACLFVYVWNIMKRKLSISVVNTERAEGGGVILHPPVTVRLFHQTNLEDNMAEILIFSPSDATFPSRRLGTFAVSVRKNCEWRGNSRKSG